MNDLTKLFAVLLLSSLAVAQVPFRATRFAGVPSLPSATDLAIGDVDGDGDLDAVVGNGPAANQLLLNDGRGRFVDATAGRLLTPGIANSTNAVDLADLDGDGDLDLLVGNDFAITNRVYSNDGTGVFTEITSLVIGGTAGDTIDQVVADFDGDGDLDWFTCDVPHARLYLNNGWGWFAEVPVASLASLPTNLGSWSNHGLAADFDGDGDPDLLLPARGTNWTQELLRNQGGGVFVPWASLPTNFFDYPSTATDFDADGDVDVFFCGGHRYLVNDGIGNLTDGFAAAFPGAQPWAALGGIVVDLDADGDPDVTTPVRTWINQGGVFLAGATYATLPTPSRLGWVSADFDGDGDDDLLDQPNFQVQLDAVAPPMRGQFYAVECTSRAAGTTLFGPAVAAAGADVALPPFGRLLLDPNQMLVLPSLAVSGSAGSFGFTVPNNPVLVGFELHYQAVVLAPGRPLFLSNAIRDVVQ